MDTGAESIAYADTGNIGGNMGSRPVNLKRITEKCNMMLE